MSTAGKEGNDSGASGLYFGTPDAKDRVPCKRIAAYTAIVIATVMSLLLFGGCYRYNVHLKRQLAGTCQDNNDPARTVRRFPLPMRSYCRAAMPRNLYSITPAFAPKDDTKIVGKANASGLF